MPGAAGMGRPGVIAPVLAPAVPAPSNLTALPTEEASSTVNRKNEPISQNGESGEANLRWGIPPIRWGGSVGYNLQRSSSSSGQGSTSQGIFSSLNAASYIYAPWAATVAGRVGLTTTSSDGTAASGTANGQGSQSRNSSLVGGGEVNIFPTSRFPFQVFFDRSDTRGSGSLVANDYVNTRFGLRQTYRGEDGYTNGGFQFDRSSVTSSLNGLDTVTALSANYGTEIGIVKNSVSGRYSLGERGLTGEKARLIGLNSAHNATLDDNINLSGNVSFLDNNLRGGNGPGSFGDTRTRFLQLNVFGTWMPEFDDIDDLPLTLSGSVRYGNLHNQFSGVGIDSTSIGGSLNGLYRFSNNLTAGANVALNQITTAGSQSILLSLVGANINYASNPLTFGKFSYNWNSGGNVSWQSGSGDIPSNLATGLQLGHTVSRLYMPSESATLSLSFTQSISANQAQSIGNSNSLSHSLALSYGSVWGDQFSGNTSISLSDILTTGYNGQHYSMLNVGFNGMGQLSSLSSANINLQFNWSQQKVDDQQNFSFQNNTTTNANTNTFGTTDSLQHMSLLGSASYTHTRFLGFRGLRYNLLFTADTRLRDDRLLGNTNGDIDRARWTLINRLDYRIGLLDFRFSTAVNDVGGKKNALLFFQVSRQIGAY